MNSEMLGFWVNYDDDFFYIIIDKNFQLLPEFVFSLSFEHEVCRAQRAECVTHSNIYIYKLQ